MTLAADTISVLPSSVKVVFPRTDSGLPSASPHVVTVALADTSVTDLDGFTGSKVFHASAVAAYTGGPSPTNATELSALALRIATDWYLYQQGRLDLVLVGYPDDWLLTGLDDCLELVHGDDMLMTRVMRGPWFDHHEELFYHGTAGSSIATDGLIVSAVDGTPRYVDVRMLLLDEIDGFSLSQPAPNVVRIDILPASDTQTGVVNTTTQTFAGGKTFLATIFARAGVNVVWATDLDFGGADYFTDTENDVQAISGGLEPRFGGVTFGESASDGLAHAVLATGSIEPDGNHAAFHLRLKYPSSDADATLFAEVLDADFVVDDYTEDDTGIFGMKPHYRVGYKKSDSSVIIKQGKWESVANLAPDGITTRTSHYAGGLYVGFTDSGGSGSGGGGITSQAIDTFNDGGTEADWSITVADNSLLVLCVTLWDDPSGGVPTSVLFNGVPMSLAVSYSDSTHQLYSGLYYLHVVAGTTANVHVGDGLGGGDGVGIELQAIQVNGLTNWTLDQTGSAHGSTSPSVATSSPTTVAAEYIQALFSLYRSGSAPVIGSWGGSFTSGGQDLANNAGSDYASATEGYRIVSSTGTYTASLSGSTQTAWTGLIASFS